VHCTADCIALAPDLGRDSSAVQLKILRTNAECLFQFTAPVPD
jgi:hypothetical protein